MTLRSNVARLRAILVALAVAVCPARALAAPIVASSVSSLSDGSFLYAFELSNPADDVESVFDLGLFFSGDPLDVTTPTVWDYIAGIGFIDWFSLSPDTDLVAGESLTGFSFRSLLAPGPIEFQTIGWNAAAGEPGVPYFGTTTGPVAAPVPEPATLSLIGIGLAGVGIRSYRKR